MARIENVNIDGTSYDVGKIATTSAPGVVQVGSGLGVTNAGVLSANVTSVNGSTGAVTINVPTVNNATLTIQKNGSTVKTFTANASSNVTANITVPTQTSDLTNNSGFLTSSTGVTSVNGNHGAVTGIQTTSNLVTSVSSSSTNSQYPSAKLFYDTVGNVESVLQTLNSGTGV